MKTDLSKKIIMNFTGIYDDLKEEAVLSFRDVRGCEGYLSEEAKEEIRKRIQSIKPEGIHYLDSGNYHYLSLLWLEKMQEPFQLAMFDHHTDMQPSALLPLTSCGNWLLESLDTNPNLKKVWLIGPPDHSFYELPEEDQRRVTWFSETQVNASSPDQLLKDFDPSLPVYLSVDKDVLSEEELSTNWDQGTMTLECLEKWIRFFRDHGKIIGLDLCGEEEGCDSMEINRRLERAADGR